LAARCRCRVYRQMRANRRASRATQRPRAKHVPRTAQPCVGRQNPNKRRRTTSPKPQPPPNNQIDSHSAGPKRPTDPANPKEPFNDQSGILDYCSTACLPFALCGSVLTVPSKFSEVITLVRCTPNLSPQLVLHRIDKVIVHRW